MLINLNKPHLWKAEVARSARLDIPWFMELAPQTNRDTRVKAAARWTPRSG